MANELLDVDRMTRNMESSGTGIRCSLATKHKPFGMGESSTVLHAVEGVRIDWRTRAQADLLAVFKCGASTQHPVFFDDADQPFRKCSRCFRETAEPMSPRSEPQALSAVLAPITPETLIERTLVPRFSNPLRRNGLQTLADLAELSRQDLSRIRGFGSRALHAVELRLAHAGLALSSTDRSPAFTGREWISQIAVDMKDS